MNAYYALLRELWNEIGLAASNLARHADAAHVELAQSTPNTKKIAEAEFYISRLQFLLELKANVEARAKAEEKIP